MGIVNDGMKQNYKRLTWGKQFCEKQDREREEVGLGICEREKIKQS